MTEFLNYHTISELQLWYKNGTEKENERLDYEENTNNSLFIFLFDGWKYPLGSAKMEPE